NRVAGLRTAHKNIECGEKKVTPIGQEVRPAMAGNRVFGIERRYGGRGAATLADLGERVLRARGEDDNALTIPGAASSGRRVAQNLNRPSARRDLLQLTVAEESDPGAVRRPEGISGSIGSRERLG